MAAVMLFLAFVVFIVAIFIGSIGPRFNLVPLGLALWVGATVLPKLLANIAP